MYTVLLATNQENIKENFARFAGWETMGFVQPIIVSNAAEAAKWIQDAPPDAVAIDLPKAQSARLYDLLQAYPHTLYLMAVSDPNALPMALEELHDMLERACAQETGGSSSEALLPELREAFWQTLLDGMITSEHVLAYRLQTLAFTVNVDTPCCLLTLSLPDGNVYLQQVWRYGRARLRIALRKFLQTETPELLYVLGSLTQQGIRLLAVPLQPMCEQALSDAARNHVLCALRDIAEYLDLEIALQHIQPFERLALLLTPQEGKEDGIH